MSDRSFSPHISDANTITATAGATVASGTGLLKNTAALYRPDAFPPPAEEPDA